MDDLFAWFAGILQKTVILSHHKSMAEQTSGNRVKTTPDEPLIFLVVAAVGTVTPVTPVTILPVAISPHTIGPIRIVVAKKPP